MYSHERENSHKIFHIFLLLVSVVSSSSNPTVSISSAINTNCTAAIRDGTLFGLTKDTLDPSRKVCAYMGIPFAAPPLGNLRFKPPTPPQPFGQRNATSFPNWCPQPIRMQPPEGTEISEDCLYLNVYVPQINATDQLSVMVWIHGGGYTWGSSNEYTPEKLLARGDVILVVPHYRLGLLGFLSSGDAVAPGNWALKDQAFAIRWVKDNIVNFGGNPEQITIFGESAGAAAAMFQMVSPLNKGLLSGVIAQSRSILVPWATDPTPLDSLKKYATVLSCPSSNNEDLVECLRGESWERIIEAQGIITANSSAGTVPVLEPDLPGAFIARSPLEIIESGEIDKIPLMIGSTNHDGSFRLGAWHLSYFGPLGLDEDPEYLRNQLIPYLLTVSEIEEAEGGRFAASTVELTYLNGANRSRWDEIMPGLVDLVTVTSYKSPALYTAELLYKQGHNVFLYSMDHQSDQSMWDYLFPGENKPRVNPGVGHMDDLLYLFNFGEELRGDDIPFSELMCDLWTNFGMTGDPTPDEKNGDYFSRIEKWPAYNPRDEFYMSLDTIPTVGTNYKNSWRPNAKFRY